MPLTCASPHYLLLLPPLLLFVWAMGRRSLAGLEPARRRLALGLRLTVVTLLVLALAELQWRDRTDQVDVIFLLDVSRSVPEDRVQAALAAVGAAQHGMHPTRDLGRLLVFGKDAATEARLGRDRPDPTAVASLVDRNTSDLERALRRGLEAVDPAARGRLVLLSDGNQTGGDAAAAVARARAAQIPLDVVPLEYSWDREVLVEKLVVPGEVRTDEPFLARVVVQAAVETPARVTLTLDGAVIERRDVVLQPGANVESFQLELTRPEFSRIQALVEPLGQGADHLPQNNVAHGFVSARGKSRLLYLHDPADPGGQEGTYLLDALLAEGIAPRVAVASDLPLESFQLQSYDCVILDDVERGSLSERQQKALETAVHDLGLGLIMIGGDRSFGAGDWRGSPVETALPVEMDIKHEEVIPDGALAMVIHSCEYPDGNAMAVKVCQAAVDGLSAKDKVGVLIFDGLGGDKWVVPLQPAQNKPGIKAAIGKMEPGDMPSFVGIFQMAIDSLSKTDAAVKHMLLMSDGDPTEPDPGQINECRRRRITVSTICYFSHGGAQGPHAQVLRRIANMTGGKYYYIGPEDANKLPRIFAKESQRVARSLIVNQDFVPTIRTRSPVLTGLDALPGLTGYVLTEPKSRAEVAMVSPDGAPILAHWQYGVGRSLAFTSDAKPRWATNWVRWGGFRSFWAQAVRWASRQVEEANLQLSTSVRGDRGVVALDATTPDGEYLDALDVTARVTPPEGGEPIEVQLHPRGPGRYEGDFPIGELGTYSVNVAARQDGELKHAATTGLVFPYPEEFKRLKSDRPALEELARQGGGRVLSLEQLADRSADPWDPALLPERVTLLERWPLLLSAALLLFLFDVAVRRIAVDVGRFLARVRARLRRDERHPDQEGAALMSRLQERKAAVREEQRRPEPPPAGGPLPKFQAGEGAKRARIAGHGEPEADRPAPDAPAEGGAQAAPPPREDGTYNRLLKAKRRARQELEGPDAPPPPPTQDR